MAETKIDEGLEREKQRENSVPPNDKRRHLKPPWPKGVSGNPLGRARARLSPTAALRRAATRADLDAIARRVISQAKHGNLAATKLIFDRLDGPMSESLLNVAVGVNAPAPAFELSRAEVDAILLERFRDIRLAESGAIKPLPEPAGQAPAGEAVEPGDSG